MSRISWVSRTETDQTSVWLLSHNLLPMRFFRVSGGRVVPTLVACSVSPVPGDTKTARLMVFTTQDDRPRDLESVRAKTQRCDSPTRVGQRASTLKSMQPTARSELEKCGRCASPTCAVAYRRDKQSETANDLSQASSDPGAGNSFGSCEKTPRALPPLCA